jgi:hypothetical protein
LIIFKILFSIPTDIDLNNENGRTDLFDSVKWGIGSRQNQEPLTFSTVPGRRVKKSVGTPLPLLLLLDYCLGLSHHRQVASTTWIKAPKCVYTIKNNKNRNHNQNLETFSRFRKWQNTCASEIKRYIALILAMGIISQSDINEYWSTDPVTSIPQVYQDCRHEKISSLSTESFLRLMKCFDGGCRQN